ncbi:uncharacterized protein [Dendropsophus ebraccatus]
MPACMVKGCTPTTRLGEHDVILHIFPKDKDIIRQWLVAVNQNMENLEELVETIFQSKNQKYRLCSVHFGPTCYMHNPKTGKRRLNPNAVPSIFPVRGVSTEDLSEDFSPRPLKRKRVDLMGHGVVSLKPGERCPTCSQIFQATHPKTKETAEKATVYDPYYGMTRTKVQATVRSFSIRVQCNKLRGKRKTVPRPQKSLVFGQSIDEVSTASTKSTSTPHETISNFQQGLDVQSRLPGGSLKQNMPVDFESESESETSCSSESSPASEGESDDSPLDEQEDVMTFSKTNFDSKTPVNVHPVNQRKFIVYESCLDALLFKIPCQFRGCSGRMKRVKKKTCGSYLSVFLQCTSRHYQKVWESQPKIDGKPAGNIELSGAVLLSGNAFAKMQQFFNVMNMVGVSESTCYRYQKNYLFPAIESAWRLNQEENFAALGTTALCVAGDLQSDSSGRKAKYCIYTLMDVKTQKILAFDIQQLCGGAKSAGLKKIACKKALDYLLREDLNVRILCTDRHASIRKMIKDVYSAIVHEYDVHHVAKSIGKKLLMASKRKNCEELAHWIGPAKNHLCWSANNCSQDPNKLLKRWNSLLYHVQNIHTWYDEKCDYNACQHTQLSLEAKKQRKWLNPQNASYKTLKKIVTDARLQKDLKHLSQFCHAGDMEVFHSHILKYRSKWQHFGIDGVQARIQLAALDHNENINRIQAASQHTLKSSRAVGAECYNATNAKARKEWLARAIYEPTNQRFLKDLLREVIEVAAGHRSID